MNTDLKYNIGDRFWQVVTRPNFSAKKIKMTDENGFTWYRYEEAKTIYRIVEFEIVGRIHIETEGDNAMWCEEEYVDHYAIAFADGGFDRIYEEDLDNERMLEFFRSREEAEAEVERLKAAE